MGLICFGQRLNTFELRNLCVLVAEQFDVCELGGIVYNVSILRRR